SLAANWSRPEIGAAPRVALRPAARATGAVKKHPGGRAAGAYCSSSTSISRSGQEVLVDTRRDRQVVHILDVAARRAPGYLRRSTIPNTGQVIIGRQQGRRVRQRQLIVRQRRRIQVLIEELHTEVERLGEVVLEAGAR